MKNYLIKITLLITTCLGLASCATGPNLQSPFMLSNEHPENVALLLPLHGRLAQTGKAIRNGFLASYYYSQQHGQANIKIRLFDTSKSNVVYLYKQAVKRGAQFIVGPLTKQNVKAIAALGKLPVTTLALNTLDNYMDSNVYNLYQFGLFAADEAAQVAAKAWKEHPGRALIIAPNNRWGQAQASILQNTWQSFGGKVAGILSFNSASPLDPQVAQTLNITLSKNDALNLRRIIGKRFKFTPRRRQDINAILLIAFPNQARQIQPLLKFYFAGNIPIYATSTIYTGKPTPYRDRDLDGITFCDMPWTLQKDKNLPAVLPALRKQIIQLWPNSYSRYIRLYGLGIDSYYLMLNLKHLLQHPHSGIAGATGIFYIDSYRHIYRQLTWATIKNGIPQPQPTTTEKAI